MTMEDLHLKLNSLALSGMADSYFIVKTKQGVKYSGHNGRIQKQSRHLNKDNSVQLSLFD